MLGLTIAPYSDDFCMAESMATIHSIRFSFLQLISMVGPQIDPEKHFRYGQPFPRRYHRLLQLCIIRITPSYKCSQQGSLPTVKLPPSVANSTACTSPALVECRVAARLPSFHQYSKRTFLSEDIIASIAFFRILLQKMRSKPSVSPLAYPQCLVRRNAAGWRVGRLDLVVYDLDNRFAYSSHLVQTWFFSLMRNACIGQLRLLLPC